MTNGMRFTVWSTLMFQVLPDTENTVSGFVDQIVTGMEMDTPGQESRPSDSVNGAKRESGHQVELAVTRPARQIRNVIRIAVESARRNTNLKPVLVYSGGDHPFLETLHGPA